MREMNRKKINQVLKLHKKWLNNEIGGVRADLQGANLQYADLKGANLQYANLQYANLQYANLYGASLEGANLHGANLQYANLQYANLQNVNLQGAHLYSANLEGVNLQDANLQDANLDFSCLPLWCGGQFRADERICKQLFAHALRIAELSGVGNKTLHKVVGRFIKGWHREAEFNAKKDV
jgi:hypothetical protein